MSRIKELLETPFGISHLIDVLEEVNGFFDPPLKDRIINRSNVSSFEDYISKVLEQGYILIQYNQKEIEGFIMFYANDLRDFKAYIPLVAVRAKYHKKGVGNNLIKETIKLIGNGQMKIIMVKTWKDNSAAISLYKKYGFVVLEADNSNIILELRLTE